MHEHIRRVAVSTAYQTTVAIGLLLFPLALALRQTVGVGLPIDRVLDRLLVAYEEDAS